MDIVRNLFSSFAPSDINTYEDEVQDFEIEKEMSSKNTKDDWMMQAMFFVFFKKRSITAIKIFRPN